MSKAPPETKWDKPLGYKNQTSNFGPFGSHLFREAFLAYTFLWAIHLVVHQHTLSFLREETTSQLETYSAPGTSCPLDSSQKEWVLGGQVTQSIQCSAVC